MLQSLIVILLAIGVLRLLQSRQAPPRQPPVSDFHPGAGATDPSSDPEAADHPAFSSGEIVDGEFEELPGPEQR